MERIIELQPFCDSLTDRDYTGIESFKLTPDEWSKIREIKCILTSFAIQTTKLQNESLTLSDFYGQWARLIVDTKKFGNHILARELLTQMDNRRDALLSNQVLNACLYSDPRYQKYMSRGKKNEAVSYLKQLHERIQVIESRPNADGESTSSRLSETPEDDASSDDELESVLSCMMSEVNEPVILNQTNDFVSSHTRSIENILLEFEGTEIPIKQKVIEYWEGEKNNNPELHKLAMIVHSVSPTQTTVERAFSAMALILSPLRTCLSDEILENLLIIRLNPELYDSM